MYAVVERTALETTEELTTANLPGVAWQFASGLVTDIAASGAVTVDLDGGARTARRAASCLLEPARGDRVLVGLADTEGYVLAILDRHGSAPSVLSVAAPSNRLTVRGAQVAIIGESEVTLEAPAILARTRRFTLLADAMGLVGKVLTQAIDRWRVSAEATEIVSRDIATKAVRRIAIVEEMDSLEAGAVVQSIATATVTSANAAVIAAKEDLRLDGARVTVG